MHLLLSGLSSKEAGAGLGNAGVPEAVHSAPWCRTFRNMQKREAYLGALICRLSTFVCT